MMYAGYVSDPNRRIPYGKLLFSDGTAYRLTAADVLWTARAVAYEGGDPAATVWTLAQRYAQLRRAYPTFAAFVRGFSQPVNPEWLLEGRQCHPIFGKSRASFLCDLDRIRKREEAQEASWAQLQERSPAAVDHVLRWANGRLPNPVPRSTNFAAPFVAEGFLDRNPGAKVVLIAGNWYIQDSWAANWDPDRVTILAADGAHAGTEQFAQGSNGRRFWLVALDAGLSPLRLRRV